MIPTYERPPRRCPTTFPLWRRQGRRPAAAELDWQQFFTDARLRELIATALANNRDLRVAVLNIEQARAQYDIRNADRYPTVGVRRRGSRAPNTTGGESDHRTASASASAAGRSTSSAASRSLSQAALAQYLATEEGRKAAQITLVASVANTWLNAGRRRGTAGAHARDAGHARGVAAPDAPALRERRLVRARLPPGAVAAESARATLAQQQRQRALDLNALALLLGRRCRRTSRSASPPTACNCPTCRPACRPTCWCAGPTCARPSSS
jgi:outer membrane protein TolC